MRAQRLPCGFVLHRDRAQQQIAVAADILRHRLHGDVHAMRQRVEQHARRPGVVHDHQRSMGVRDFGDCRNVLHLHGDRAGALAPHQARGRLEQRLDLAPDGGRIKRSLDAETLQHESRELAVRAVHALRHQDVVAGFQEREVDGRDGALASRRDQGADSRLRARKSRPASSSVVGVP